MSAICNGMFAHGGVRPYCATFLNFAGYALGAIRVSALSRFGVIYVMTHDSIGLGEDGPTHQPVEMLESLRSMPNVNVLRPCDSNETNAAYRIALAESTTPSFICLSRQTLPNLPGSNVSKALKGGESLLVVKNELRNYVAKWRHMAPCLTMRSISNLSLRSLCSSLRLLQGMSSSPLLSMALSRSPSSLLARRLASVWRPPSSWRLLA